MGFLQQFFRNVFHEEAAPQSASSSFEQVEEAIWKLI